jgi:hypothetical protein
MVVWKETKLAAKLWGIQEIQLSVYTAILRQKLVLTMVNKKRGFVVLPGFVVARSLSKGRPDTISCRSSPDSGRRIQAALSNANVSEKRKQIAHHYYR